MILQAIGRKSLATLLLDSETCAAEQVPRYLSRSALRCASSLGTRCPLVVDAVDGYWSW